LVISKFYQKFAEIFASEGAPPVSTTHTGGKFATGINDTGGKFCHRYRCCFFILVAVSTILSENLLPVSTTPVANNGNNIRLLTS
jgi:hypothetical protein